MTSAETAQTLASDLTFKLTFAPTATLTTIRVNDSFECRSADASMQMRLPSFGPCALSVWSLVRLRRVRLRLISLARRLGRFGRAICVIFVASESSLGCASRVECVYLSLSLRQSDLGLALRFGLNPISRTSARSHFFAGRPETLDLRSETRAVGRRRRPLLIERRRPPPPQQQSVAPKRDKSAHRSRGSRTTQCALIDARASSLDGSCIGADVVVE